MSHGAAAMGQLCPRLVGSGTSISTLLGNTVAMLCGSVASAKH